MLNVLLSVVNMEDGGGDETRKRKHVKYEQKFLTERFLQNEASSVKQLSNRYRMPKYLFLCRKMSRKSLLFSQTETYYYPYFWLLKVGSHENVFIGSSKKTVTCRLNLSNISLFQDASHQHINASSISLQCGNCCDHQLAQIYCNCVDYCMHKQQNDVH